MEIALINLLFVGMAERVSLRLVGAEKRVFGKINGTEI
jgi:hypothetical protein